MLNVRLGTTSARPLGLLIIAFLIGSIVVWTVPAPGIPAYDLRRVLQVVLLVLVGLGAGLDDVPGRLSTAWVHLPPQARWALGAVLAVGILSALSAPRPVEALRSVSLWCLLAIVALTVAAASREDGSELKGLVLSGVVIVAVGYLGMYLLHAAFLGPATALPGFEHPRMFNHSQVLLLPLLAYAAVSDMWGGARRVILWIVLVGWWHLLFVSGGRAALLGVLVGIATGTVLVRREAIRWTVTYLVAGSVGLLVYVATLVSAPVPGPTYGVGNAIERGLTATGRSHLWSLAVSHIRTHPILGIGPGHYAHEDHVADFAASPHNLALQFTAEWGILPALLLLGLAVWGTVSWVRNTQRRTGTAYTAALTAALAGVSVDAMFGGSVNDPTAGILAAAVVGLALGRSRGYDPHERPGRSRTLVAISVVSALTLAVSTGVSYRSPAEETGNLLRPRFWLNGVIPD